MYTISPRGHLVHLPRLELGRNFFHKHLKLACLPIPPQVHYSVLATTELKRMVFALGTNAVASNSHYLNRRIVIYMPFMDFKTKWTFIHCIFKQMTYINTCLFRWISCTNSFMILINRIQRCI